MKKEFITIKNVKIFLENLQKREFYGEISIDMQKGIIVLIRKKETYKLLKEKDLTRF